MADSQSIIPSFPTQQDRAKTFSDAWPLWWQIKEQTISKKTRQCYGEYFRQLAPFFGKRLLAGIGIELIVEYRNKRRVTAGPNLINHELNALKQLMEYLGLWTPIRGGLGAAHRGSPWRNGQAPNLSHRRNDLARQSKEIYSKSESGRGQWQTPCEVFNYH